MGLDPRGQREVRSADRLLDPRLHAPRERLPARDLRRLAPHDDADRFLRGGFGEVARAPGLEGARHRRRRHRGPRRARHVQRGLSVGRGARLEPQPGDARRLRRRRAAEVRRASSSQPRPTSSRSSGARTSSSPGRTPAARSSRTSGSRPARTSPRSAPTSRASRSSTRRSSSAPGSSSTTSASAEATARSTSRSGRGSSPRTTSRARSGR